MSVRFPWSSAKRRTEPVAVTLTSMSMGGQQPHAAPALTGATADHLDDLRAKARYARERYQLYKAKTHGPMPTSAPRLRELQRAYDQAEERTRAAEAEAKRRPVKAQPPGRG